MSKVFYDKPIIDQIFEEFCKSKSKQDQNKLIKLVSILPPEDINNKNTIGNTVLILTSMFGGYVEIAKLLLEHKDIDVNIRNDEGNTALLYASIYHIKIVELLLEREDIDVNVQCNEGNTALHIAVYVNRIDTLKLLLEHKDINVNIRNNDGCTALIFARIRTAEITRLLLEHEDIDIKIQDNSGSTALNFAIDEGHTEMVELLKNHNSN